MHKAVKSVGLAVALLLLVLAVPSMADDDHDDDDHGHGEGRAEFFDLVVEGCGPGGLALLRNYADAYPTAKYMCYDSDQELGGNCNTETIPNPPPGAKVTWQEIGTAAFFDSKFVNQVMSRPPFNVTTPPYAIDAIAFANRVYPNSTFTLDPTASGNPTSPGYQFNYLFNFADGSATSPVPGTSYGLQVPSEAGFGLFAAALQSYTGLLARYPYSVNYAWPDPIPAELLQPFGLTMVQYNLFPMATLFQQIIVAGNGNYLTTPTIYVIAQAPLTLVLLLTQPGAGWAFNGGCDLFYERLVATLKPNSVTLNAYVDGRMSRSYGKGQNGAVFRLAVKQADGSVLRRQIHARKLVIAHAVTATVNSAHLDLDQKERTAFQCLRPSNQYAAQIAVEGPVTQNAFNPVAGPAPFSMLNFDFTGIPMATPRIDAISRGLPYGPAASIILGGEQILTRADAEAIIASAEAELIEAGKVQSLTLLQFDAHNVYGPQCAPEALAVSPNTYTLQRDLDGYRNTWWIGTQRTGSPSTVDAWNMGYLIVSKLNPDL